MHIFIRTVILQNPSAMHSARLNGNLLFNYENYDLGLSPPKFTLNILKMAVTLSTGKKMAVSLNKSI